ncbi:MAG: hypothetical protein GY856_09105 [bacterium]|nr:hypothetical protein [bacterium]
MEYHILNVAGRLAAAPSRNALLLVACLLALACNFSFSPGVRKARREVDRHFDFIRPVTGGFDIASCTGSVVRTVRVPKPSTTHSFTPDYSGFVFSHAEWDSESTLHLSVKVKLAGLEPFEVLSHTHGFLEFGRPDYEVDWLSADGSSFLVRDGPHLSYLFKDQTQIRRELIAEDVKCLAASFQEVYLLFRSGPPMLYRWNLLTQRPPLSTEILLPEKVNRIAATGERRFLIAFRTMPEYPGIFRDFLLVDLDDGNVRSLETPIDGQILELYPLDGTTNVLLTVWRYQRERLDGTVLQEFHLWNFRRAKTVHVSTNYKAFMVHPLAVENRSTDTSDHEAITYRPRNPEWRRRRRRLLDQLRPRCPLSRPGRRVQQCRRGAAAGLHPDPQPPALPAADEKRIYR